MNLHFWLFGIAIYLASAAIVYLIVRHQHNPGGEREDEIPSLRHVFFVFVPFINTLAAVTAVLAIITYGLDMGDMSDFFRIIKKKEK